MKRSLLIAAAAATAVALLTGCSTTPSDKTADPKPSASESATTDTANPATPPKIQPPKGADPALTSFAQIAVASCDKATAEGSVAKSRDVTMITVPEAKAIDLVTDVAIAKTSDGQVLGNYIVGPTPRTGKPVPFVCSISGFAYTDLMTEGKSTRVTGEGDAWTWKDGNMNVEITLKDGMIDSYVQIVDNNGTPIKMDFDVTYGLTEADLKAFANAVANPTKPATPPTTKK